MTWTGAVLAMVLAVGADAPPPARPSVSPSDLMSVDPSLGRTDRFVLPNGMTVILAPDFEAPVVGMELSYQVGLRDEPDQRSGLTSLVQGLMLGGTKHVAVGEYNRLLRAAGGRWSWRTGVDRSVFAATVPSDAIALPLWLWSDQMGYLTETLTDARIAQQVAEVDDDYVRRTEDAPLGHLSEIRDRLLYPPGHPYHHAANRPGPSLRGLTAAEVRAFIERYYRPDRARLVLSGAFDPGRARLLVTQYFATLRGVGGPRRIGQRAVVDREARIHLAARVELPSVTLAWSTPPEFEPDDAALDAIAELLVGHRAGLLRFKLIDELKIATLVSAHQFSRRLGSAFVISATAAPGHTTAELLTAIDAVLREAMTHPPSDYFLVGAVAGYVIEHAFLWQDHSFRAGRYAVCDELGVLSTCFDTWLRGYLSLSARDLSSAISRQLPLDRRVVIEVVPSADAPIAGELRDSQP